MGPVIDSPERESWPRVIPFVSVIEHDGPESLRFRPDVALGHSNKHSGAQSKIHSTNFSSPFVGLEPIRTAVDQRRSPDHDVTENLLILNLRR